MLPDDLINISAFLLTSVVLAALISSVSASRLKRKELVAEATKSALKRVEMYYRIRRRIDGRQDKLQIRDDFHTIQEENDYYCSLLSVESVWLGHRYKQFIEAIKRGTNPLIKEAWNERAYGPDGELQKLKHPDVDKYIKQFAKDSRRLFNPISRVIMRAKHMLQKWVDTRAYE